MSKARVKPSRIPCVYLAFGQAVCLFDCCHSATVANLAETMVVQSGPLTAEKKARRGPGRIV